MVRFQLSFGEGRNHLEHLIGESPDVQNIGALGRLRRLIRLDVQTYQTSLRIPLPEYRPLAHQRRPAPTAEWRGNFRDLNAAVSRMATMSLGGRISVDVVAEEIERLQHSWAPRRPAPPSTSEDSLGDLLGHERLDQLDLFDRVQLAPVVGVCRRSNSLSEAGRTLFGASRNRRATTNDADRLRKYLARFGLDWSQISATAARPHP